MNKTDKIVDLYSKYVMNTYSRSRTLVKGKGTRVWDAAGGVYLDFIAGIAVNIIGHCNSAITEAIQKQAAELDHVSNLYYTEPQGILSEVLSELSMKGKCFYCNSGAEANEALFKLARLVGHDKGRYEIITMKNSFHGRTLAGIAATGQDKVKKGFEPMPDGFVHAELNNLDSVKALVNDKTAAVMLEVVQGEGGIIPADEAFLQGVRALCTEKEILMLCDECQCGMGRTGHWFGYQGFGAEPDAFALAKGIAGGMPMGVAVASPKYSDVFKPGHHASTFGGGPIACAAALATVKYIEDEKLLERASTAGMLFKEGLEQYVEQFAHVKEVRGVGLMVGMVLDEPAKPLCDKMAEMGLLTLATAGNVVRFLPPLTVKDSELEEALDIIHDALAEHHGVAAAEAAG